MPTVNIVSDMAGLEDLVTAGKAHLMVSNKSGPELTVGSANDEVGTYYDGAAYQASATFTGSLAGKGLVMVRDDSNVIHLNIWPAAAIPIGSKITACAKYLEDPADDGDSIDNATGLTKSYYKYTLTY